MQTLLNERDVEVYRKDIAVAEAYSTSLKIESDEDYTSALNEGKNIQVILKSALQRKEEITKPLNTALKSARDLFRPIEEAGEKALAIIKRKMLDYTAQKNAEAEEAKIKLANRVERGTMTSETAVRKISEIQAPETTVKTDTAKATTRTVVKYRVVDKTKIPLEFMEPDMTAIKNAFKQGNVVAGVERYEEQELALG